MDTTLASIPSLKLNLQAGYTGRLFDGLSSSIPVLRNITLYALDLNFFGIVPPVGIKLIYQLTKMTNAFCSLTYYSFNYLVNSLTNPIRISHSLQGFPQVKDYSIVTSFNIEAVLGASTYPWGKLLNFYVSFNNNYY